MKKLNKFFAILVAMAMVLSLTVISAFASEDAGTNVGTLATSKLVKELDIADNVKTPAGTLTFTFAPADVTEVVEGVSKTTEKQTSGEVTLTKTITYEAGETGSNGKLVKSFPMSDLFVLGAKPAEPAANTQYLDHAGVYIYEVTESNKTWADATDTNASHQDSNAKYRLRIYVVNDDTATTTGKLAVKAVTVEKLLNDAGQEETGVTGKKVPPTTTGSGNTEDGGFKFVNKYSKKVDGSQTEDGALKFTKAVTGELGSKTDQFQFSLELTLPSTYDTALGTTFAYTNTNGTNGNAVFDATSKKATFDFTLSDSDVLKFAVLPAGTTYTVTEKLDASTQVANANLYTATAKSYTGTATAANAAADAEGANLAVSSYVSDTLVGEEGAKALKNVVDYTNQYDKNNTTNTPTGILISNLPYIVLALVAIGGLVAYVVVRRRQSDEA